MIVKADLGDVHRAVERAKREIRAEIVAALRAEAESHHGHLPKLILSNLADRLEKGGR